MNYRNDWDGEGLNPGIYFYIVDLKKDNKVYNGRVDNIPVNRPTLRFRIWIPGAECDRWWISDSN